MNVFGYWQGQDIRKIFRTLFARQIILSSGTWPTTGLRYVSFHRLLVLNFSIGGSDYGSAIASTENAETLIKKGVCAAVAWDFNVFYFEAFDEPWKPKSIGDTWVTAVWSIDRQDRLSRSVGIFQGIWSVCLVDIPTSIRHPDCRLNVGEPLSSLEFLLNCTQIEEKYFNISKSPSFFTKSHIFPTIHSYHSNDSMVILCQ